MKLIEDDVMWFFEIVEAWRDAHTEEEEREEMETTVHFQRW